MSSKHSIYILGHSDVVVITTTQICPTKPELRLSAGSNPAHNVPKVPNDEDLWQWSWLEIRLNVFCWSAIPQKKFIIHHLHYHFDLISVENPSARLIMLKIQTL